MSTDNKTTITLELTEAEAQAVYQALLKTFFLVETTDEARLKLNDTLVALEDIGFTDVEA